MKIVDFFKRIFKKSENNQMLNAPKTQYQKLVESIDNFELSRMFVDKTIRSATPEIKKAIQQYVNNAYEYPLQTKISKDDALELARKFFESIDENLCQKYNDIVNGNNPNIVLQMEIFNGKGASVTSPDKLPVTVYVPIRDDIRQLYEMVHECTHTFDIDNGDTPTRKVLGEVAPQCMERLLDDFLSEMSDEEMQEYGFDRETLEKDIKDRRITTFLSRFHNAQTLNNQNGDCIKDSRYMLAQIYSAHFNKYDKKEKKSKIVQFIESVKTEDFDGANNTFGLSINKNASLSKLHRETYVSDTISEIVNIIEPKTQDNTTTQQIDKDKNGIER